MSVMNLLIDRRGACLAMHNAGVVEVRYEDGESHRVGLNALRRIIVPQAVRIVIPPVVNDYIALFKDTSVCSVVTTPLSLTAATSAVSRA